MAARMTDEYCNLAYGVKSWYFLISVHISTAMVVKQQYPSETTSETKSSVAIWIVVVDNQALGGLEISRIFSMLKC